MDAEQLKLLTEEMQRMSRAVETGMQNLQGVIKDTESEGVSALARLSDAWAREIEGASTDLIDISETTGEKVASALTAPLRQPLEMIGATIRGYKDELKGLARDVDQRALRGRDKAGGMFEGLATLNRTVFAGLPFGGILGVMLFGRMQEAEYFSKAQQATQVFQRAGSIGRATFRELVADIRPLEQAIPGIAQAFAASNAAAAEMGFTGADAAMRVNSSIEMARDNVRNLATAMDLHFEAGQGASMKFAATIAQNTNAELRESVELVRDIGLAAQNNGLSFNAMLGSVMQTTSALRLQTNEMSEVRDIALAIAQAQAGLRAQGFSRQGAGAVATSGLEGIAGIMSTMQIGLKSVLGERMTDGQDRGLEAVMRFEQGFREQSGSSFFQRALGEIMSLSKELGRGDPAQQYQVLKALFGMSAEQAQVLMAIQRANDEGLSVAEATSRHSGALNRAFKDEALKQSTFRTMMNQLIQVVAKFGSSLLDAVVSGLEVLVASVAYIGKYISVGVSSADTRAYQQLVLRGGERFGEAVENAMDAFSDSSNIGSRFAETVLGRNQRDMEVSTRFYRGFGDVSGERRSLGDDTSLFGRERRPTLPTPPSVNRAAGRFRQERYMDVEVDIPPGGGKAIGRLRFQAPATPEP